MDSLIALSWIGLALSLGYQPVAWGAPPALVVTAASPALRQEVQQGDWSPPAAKPPSSPMTSTHSPFVRFLEEHAWHILTVFVAEEADRVGDSRTSDPPPPALGGPSPDTQITNANDSSHGFLVDHKSAILRAVAVGSIIGVNGLEWGGYPDDLMGLVEAHKFNWSTSGLVKNIVQRQRPHSTERDSFYSDAASTAFTWMAYTDSVLARGFEGHPAARVGTAIGLYGMAAYIGRSRVLAGRHYTSDVLAGAAAGFTVGKLFYRANHRLDEDAREPGRVSLEPSLIPGGAALSVSIVF